MLWLGFATTDPQQANCINDRRKLWSCRICSSYWWLKPKIHINSKILCTGRLWLKNIYPSPDKDVNLRKRISCDLFCIQGIWANFLGRAETGHYTHRQQSRDRIFSDENHTASPVERMWLCHSVQFCHSTHPRGTKYDSRLIAPPRSRPQRQFSHENREDVQNLPIEINVQSAGVSRRAHLLH